MAGGDEDGVKVKSLVREAGIKMVQIHIAMAMRSLTFNF